MEVERPGSHNKEQPQQTENIQPATEQNQEDKSRCYFISFFFNKMN